MSKFHALTIADLRRETADTVSIAFAVPSDLSDDFQFIQGQYLTLRATINDEDVRRSYSICSSPLDGELRVAIKKVPQGRFSTFANEQLQIGDTLQVMEPMGNFYTTLAASNANHYVAFVAGSGITPVLSIMKSVLQIEPESRFTLFYGNKTVDSIIFREEIEALKSTYLERLSVHHILSQERLGSAIFNGRIDGEKCTAYSKVFFEPGRVSAYFLCGPEPMIRGVKESLVGLGVAENKIHFELFTSPVGNLGKPRTATAETQIDAEQESAITVKLDGIEFDFSLRYGGESLLDAALKQGADLPFACKGGVCCTCRAKLVEGTVEMDVNYALEPEEVEAGFILTCQSHPRSERIIVDFDQQ